MWPFKKKNSNSESIKPQVCDHKFKDFKWYIEAHYDNSLKMLEYKIIEPYVCIFCGERKNVVLREFTTYIATYEEASDCIESLQKKYKDKIQNREITEDEIHDMILVDREYLEIYAKLHPSN